MTIGGLSAYTNYSGYMNYSGFSGSISGNHAQHGSDNKTGAYGKNGKTDKTAYAKETATVSGNPDKVKKTGRRSSPADCETCKRRKYQDGSNENVSFKSPTHISAGASGAAVRAHEAEHVSNAYSKAKEKNGEVLSVNVSIKTAICPECGTVYTAGGETRTTIKYPNESNPYQKNQKSLDSLKYAGANIDYAA